MIENQVRKINKKQLYKSLAFKRNKNISNKQQRLILLFWLKNYIIYTKCMMKRFKEKILTTVNNFVTIPNYYIYTIVMIFKKKVIKKFLN